MTTRRVFPFGKLFLHLGCGLAAIADDPLLPPRPSTRVQHSQVGRTLDPRSLSPINCSLIPFLHNLKQTPSPMTQRPFPHPGDKSIFPPWHFTTWTAMDDRVRGGSSISHLDPVEVSLSSRADDKKPKTVTGARFWGHLGQFCSIPAFSPLSLLLRLLQG